MLKTSELMEMHKRVMELSDPMLPVRRQLLAIEAMEEDIKADALMSGAMPRDFRVALVFQRHPRGFGPALVPRLA